MVCILLRIYMIDNCVGNTIQIKLDRCHTRTNRQQHMPTADQLDPLDGGDHAGSYENGQAIRLFQSTKVDEPKAASDEERSQAFPPTLFKKKIVHTPIFHPSR